MVAVALPVRVAGGHSAAHSPLHALFVPVSASNRYSVWPSLLTSTVPTPGTLAVATAAGPLAAVVPLDVVPPWRPLPPADELLLFAHAARPIASAAIVKMVRIRNTFTHSSRFWSLVVAVCSARFSIVLRVGERSGSEARA